MEVYITFDLYQPTHDFTAHFLLEEADKPVENKEDASSPTTADYHRASSDELKRGLAEDIITVDPGPGIYVTGKPFSERIIKSPINENEGQKSTISEELNDCRLVKYESSSSLDQLLLSLPISDTIQCDDHSSHAASPSAHGECLQVNYLCICSVF